ncbi:hypothetical protein AbraIFM66950_004129, partial [Aspergillus brasiliensis]
MGSVDLVQFPDLKCLSWKGPKRHDDIECLKDCIRFHGHQLVSLALDAAGWYQSANISIDEESEEEVPQSLLFQRLLNIKPEHESVIFQSLEYLDLSSISLEHADVEIPPSVSFENLGILKLRK